MITSNVLDYFLTGILICLAILLVFVLIRAILGPDIGDRLMAVNMAGTITIMIICVLAVKLKETFLGDVPVVYALISFVAVVILAKIYVGVYRQNKKEK